MSKRSNEIPPIKGTPGLGKETATDPAVVWTGGRVPKQPGASKGRKRSTTSTGPGASKKGKRSTTSTGPGASKKGKPTKRRTSQQSIGITDKPGLKELAKVLGINASAVVNLALARLKREYL